MPEPTTQEVADKLLVAGFARSTPDVASLTDPIADTPMVVTLDQLKPYDLNPRVTRNPRHDDIKASVRERGLDAAPPITRRPGESHFIIRNGGNTRLTILQELWSETKDERFFRITCLFRPWSARGELLALTGHLAENELRGGLSFIERALGVEKARELYEQEIGKPLNQTELARRLRADGYPVTQPHISRMQDAVRYLLPAIPSLLYGGLGKHQIERLATLRKAASLSWDLHAQGQTLTTDFASLFQEVLALFDGEPDTFHVQRVQDELVGQMSELLKVDYNALALEFVDAESRQRVLNRELPIPPASEGAMAEKIPSLPAPRTESPPSKSAPSSNQPSTTQANTPLTESAPASAPTDQTRTPAPVAESHSPQREHPPPSPERLQGHIVSPIATTDRLQAIQRRIAEATGESVQDFQSNVVRAIPVQAGGLHPISDVWYIEPALDAPDRLRTHIAQLAREIAQEADLADRIESVHDGIGFLCSVASSGPKEPVLSPLQRGVLALLHALSTPYVPSHRSKVDDVRLADHVAPVLQGALPSRRTPQNSARLGDAGLVKLFRLIRLARRLLELELAPASQSDGA